MNKLIDLITNSSQQIQALLFAGILFIGWNIENVAGLTTDYKKWKHAFMNVPFIFTNLLPQFIFGFAFAATIAFTEQAQFGLMHWLPFPENKLLLFVSLFLLLDLGEYAYHVIMHKVKRFWMFHLVHHSDQVVDVSTTLREHPGENVIRLSFTLLWVFLTGAPLWVIIFRQIIQVGTTLFAHMNYRLPKKVNAVVGLVFITPNLHHVHHHFEQPYTDCNYGDVLSIWDRIFGTFQQLPDEELTFGVDTYMAQEDIGTFKSLFKIPFGEYRKAGESR